MARYNKPHQERAATQVEEVAGVTSDVTDDMLAEENASFDEITDTTKDNDGTPVVPEHINSFLTGSTPNHDYEQDRLANNTKPVEEKPLSGNVDEIVKAIIISADSVENKIAKIKEVGSVGYNTLVAKLESYNEIMTPKSVGVTDEIGAGKNFDLFSTLKAVINTEHFITFKTKFDIVNMFFRLYTKEAYCEEMLHRYDLAWKWGEKPLTTYQNLITLISMLADKETRQKVLSSEISLSKALDKDSTIFTDIAIDNITKYYNS